jgi:nucleoside phosphorylase
MESYEIIAEANRVKIPAVVVRVISDSLDRKMPDFDRALKPDGDFDGIKALGIAAASPVTTLKMLAASRRAIRHLQKALELILPADCF